MNYIDRQNAPKRVGEVNNLPSMTIPDMSLSLRDIVERYRMGTLPVEFVRSVLYDECDDFDSVLAENLESYDLVDKQTELNKLRQKFEAMHARPRGESRTHDAPQGSNASPTAPNPASGMAEESNDIGLNEV